MRPSAGAGDVSVCKRAPDNTPRSAATRPPRSTNVRGGRSTVLALGKLGSSEMSAASDLDLILVYDFDEAHPHSVGPRPLHAVQYYARLTQRLVSALTVPTKRGPQ